MRLRSALLASPPRLCLLALLLTGISAELRAQAVRYFPLEPGTVWRYSSTRFTGSLIERSVVGLDDDGLVIFNNGFQLITLEDELDIIRIDIPEEGLQLLYDFEDFQWTRRDVNICDDQREALLNSRNETIVTPAGTFTDCLRVEYLHGQCADAGLVTEWFAPDVGLVKWEEFSILGLVTWELEETDLLPETDIPFRRSDVNQDRKIDVSDPIGMLSYLFLGDTALSCEKAADANDDGFVDVSDPVHLLSHIFLGNAPPAPPFEACGEDPTLDLLTCESFTACQEGLLR